MAANEPRKTKSKRRGRPRVERVYHVIQFIRWDWDFMFGIADPRRPWSDDPYMDYRYLTIEGSLLRPSTLKPDSVEVTLSPDRRLSDSDDRKKHQPKAVGGISHWGRKDYRASLHLPADAFGPVLQMMIAGRYRFVVIEAEKSLRGEALVRNFRFSAKLDEDDLAEE